MITKKQIANTISKKRLLKDKIKQILVPDIRTISYRDIIELYLYISGNRDYEWTDTKKNTTQNQILIKSIINILVDIIVWPFLYLFYSKKVASLDGHNKSSVSTSKTKLLFNSVLFLRTDHWFNVKSGGSVGHLSGVINGFSSLDKNVQVVSSDFLVGIHLESDFHLCSPKYSLGRNLPNIPEITYNGQLIAFLKSEFKNNYPSFIYQRYSLGNYVGAYLRTQHQLPFVCEYNGSFIWMAKHWDNKKLFHANLLEKIELINLFAADVIVVVSEAMKEELVNRGIQAKKILVNPNGVDPKKYSPEVDGFSIRTKYNFDENKVVVGFIGTFGPWHGAEVLAAAIGLLLEKHPDYRKNVRLMMVGDGIKLTQVTENIKKYGLEDKCIMTGLIPQEEGPSHLAACDILASPHVPNPDGTPFFGSPTKLFEYMAMGKGIIASNLNQIGNILQHKQTAWLVKPGDTESLMVGLKTLIDNRRLREELGQKARKDALENYTWHKHTQRIITKLEDTCVCA